MLAGFHYNVRTVALYSLSDFTDCPVIRFTSRQKCISVASSLIDTFVLDFNCYIFAIFEFDFFKGVGRRMTYMSRISPQNDLNRAETGASKVGNIISLATISILLLPLYRVRRNGQSSPMISLSVNVVF